MNRRDFIKNTVITGLVLATGSVIVMTNKHAVLNMDNVPDSQGDTFDQNGVSFEEVVPVILNHDKNAVVGIAKLTIENQTLFAEFTLADEFKFVTPAVDGWIHEKVPNEHGGHHITKCSIKHISLQVSKNSDKRIKPLIGKS